MKISRLLILLLLFGPIAYGQETKKTGLVKASKCAFISTGISVPMGNFSQTAAEIGPKGNAKPGFYIAGSVDLFWKFAGWKIEANTTFNPIETKLLYIKETFPDVKTGTWTNTKLLTGPQIKLGSDELYATIGVMLGGMWLYYPAFTIESDDEQTVMKIQNTGICNFAQQLHVTIHYPISEKISLGVTLKYEHANAKAQYLQIIKSYHLGNAYNLEYETGVPHRISNDPPPLEAYTGWVGYGKSEVTVNQKVMELKIGMNVQIKL